MNTSPRRQSGVTLIVVMVILLVVTLLGLASTSDSRLQLAMARNSQFQTAAHTAALSEINAQIDDINGNAVGQTDQVIVDLLNATPTSTTLAGVSVSSRTLQSGIGNNNQITRFLLTILGSNKNSYGSSLILREPDINVRLPVSGMSLGPGSTIKWRRMEFESMAEIEDTGFQSKQVQGFRYLAPN